MIRKWSIDRGGLVLLLAVLIRVWVAVDVRDAPFWTAPMVDEIAYLQMSEKVVRGIEPEHGAWYMTPGYAWFLAGLSKAGAQVPQVKLVQLLLGVLSSWLVFVLGRGAFDARVGTGAGLLFAVAPWVLLHEVLILKPALTLFCVLLGLWSVMREDGREWQWAIGGLAFGAATLLRGEMLLVGLLLVVGGVLATRFDWQIRPRRAAAPLVAAVVLLSVVAVPTVQNLARGGGFVVVAYSGGPNFYIGNHDGADGSYLPLRPDRSDAAVEEADAVQIAREGSPRALDAAGVSRYWWNRGWSWWADEPGQALALTAKKAALFLGAWEGVDVLSREIAAKWVVALRNPLVRAGFVLPLALVGLLVLRPWSRAWPLVLFVGASWLALIPFFVFERFRLPIVAVGGIFAAAALVAGFDAWRAGKRSAVLAAGLGAVALTGLLAMPSVPRDATVLRVNVGGMLLQQGRFAEALEEFEIVRRATPSAKRVEINIATALRGLGRKEEAIAALARALEFLYAEARGTGRPALQELGYCHELSGDLESELGHPERAAEHYRAILTLVPGHGRVRSKLAALGVE